MFGQSVAFFDFEKNKERKEEFEKIKSQFFLIKSFRSIIKNIFIAQMKQNKKSMNLPRILTSTKRIYIRIYWQIAASLP